MFKHKTFLVMALSVLLASAAWAGDPKPEEYSQTITNFKEIPQVAPFFGNSYGYAVFPTIGKGGLGDNNTSEVAHWFALCRIGRVPDRTGEFTLSLVIDKLCP